MDQEDTMDFKALRARFQDEELLLKQNKSKPALPEKPKVVPPPQSPTRTLPAGARPSLLTSINQSLEGGTIAPRVVFKDEKKESKKPLIQINSRGKEGKLKKDKSSKGSKEKLDDSSEPKPKKEKDKKLLLLPVGQKEASAELVPATPPPKAATPKKKGLLGLKKSSKRDSAEVPADPILDTLSSEVSGPAPLIPVPSDFTNTLPELNIPALPDPGAGLETHHHPLPDPLVFAPPPLVTPDIPAPEVLIPDPETQFEIETPSLNVSRPSSPTEMIPSPPSATPTPPPSRATFSPPAEVSFPSAPSPLPPEPDAAAEATIEAMILSAVEKPPPLTTPPPPLTTPPPPLTSDPPAASPSPKPEHPISALSALERAEEMTPPTRRTTPSDQRILNALEKARRKSSSPQTSSSRFSVTPPPEDLPRPQSPAPSLPELPPIDYEGKLAPVNGVDHRQSSPPLEGITEEGPDPVPELLVVPPPLPRKVLPDPEALGPAPEKPDRPPSVDLSPFLPPQVEDHDIPVLPDLSETDATDVPEFDDVTLEAHSPELPESLDGYTGPDLPDGLTAPVFYGNGISVPGNELRTEPEFKDDLSVPVPQDLSPTSGPQVENGSGAYESAENVYEDVGTSGGKKKSKGDGGKKRKGALMNPYAEAAEETNPEKTKTSRFGKVEKKVSSEGPDEKELKKREKQRLEKEKKELKEKQEREKKEMKEKEKKENELKKKFKITGQEDAMYQAKVTMTTKGRKNDLPVKSGDIVSIIRTTNCPKGKWLARDSSNNYGYVAVDHVELDIKEMLELGKKARKTSSNVTEPEAATTDGRASNHYPLSAESFTDDSEEWTGDDEEPVSPTSEPADPLAPVGHIRTISMPDMGNKELSVNHQHSHSTPEHSQDPVRNEALQKLATFFRSPKPVESPVSSEPKSSPVLVTEEVHMPGPGPTQEIDFEDPNMIILPPPDLYADFSVE